MSPRIETFKGSEVAPWLAHVDKLRIAAFCAVDRRDDDPRKPVDYRSNDAFWAKRGYVRQPGMRMRLGWKEIDRGEVENTLTFWLRDWRDA